jgi:hypothetical protein
MMLAAVLIVGIIAGLLLAAFIGGLTRAPARSSDPLHDWHDNANVIRIDEKEPTGFPICLAWECRVAGISYREADAEDFIAGRNRSLQLVREPDNTVSPLAVKVVGEWRDSAGNLRLAQLGYIPSDIAESIATRAPDAKLAAALRDLFIPMQGKGAGIRLNVWADSQLEPKVRRRRYAARRRAEKKQKPN